jgi:capsular exopolysaccharide synthesis family protein
MTRLSDALKRAAESGGRADTAQNQPMPPEPWHFAPVETIFVPDEPVAEAAALPQPAATTPPESTTRPVSMVNPAAIAFGAADRDKLVIAEHVEPNLVEQYRHLAAVLHHSQKSSGTRSVMVTSAVASEGKTLTATNLALTLSQSYQRRVLLIDADLRRPRIKEMFDLPPTAGLTDSLTGTGEQLPVHRITPMLWVLTAGSIVPDPMSLLVSPAMKQLLEDARASFDWVVVDTPPIAILPDAHLLSAMIDTALLVVSAKSTPYPMVQRAAEKIGPKRILGVVLNRADHAVLPVGGYYGYPGSGRSKREGRRWFRLPSLRRSGSRPDGAAAAGPSLG